MSTENTPTEPLNTSTEDTPIESPSAAATTGHQPGHKRLLALSLLALGIVYGDIGTSPLYALRECFYGSHAVAAHAGRTSSASCR